MPRTWTIRDSNSVGPNAVVSITMTSEAEVHSPTASRSTSARDLKGLGPGHDQHPPIPPTEAIDVEWLESARPVAVGEHELRDKQVVEQVRIGVRQATKQDIGRLPVDGRRFDRHSSGTNESPHRGGRAVDRRDPPVGNASTIPSDGWPTENLGQDRSDGIPDPGSLKLDRSGSSSIEDGTKEPPLAQRAR